MDNVKLDLIDDNPYNPRKHYPQAKIKEMGISLQEVGLRQVPEGRRVDGRVQLAYGHMRLRGFRYNEKHCPRAAYQLGDWGEIPVDIKEISDADMFHYAMEENLRRTDITPIEVARCITAYNTAFPDVLDEDIAKKHGMTPANVSNMKRVLRLPERFLEKIDEGIITFTQGRELLTLEGLPDADDLMSRALAGINTTGNKSYSNPNTVEGLQKSIHSTIRDKFPPLDKDYEGYRYKLLFDSRAANCLKCDKCLITHPTKSQSAHYCTDVECWEKKTDEHKALAAVAAKARMEAEVLERVAREVEQRPPEEEVARVDEELSGFTKQGDDLLNKELDNISQEKPAGAEPKYTLQKRGTGWIALNEDGLVIAMAHDKEQAGARAVDYFAPVPTVVNPGAEDYRLNHTYRISLKPNRRPDDFIFDYTAQDLATAVYAAGVSPEDIESVKVWKSSGKIGTGGDVSAGWSKCTETLDTGAENVEPPAPAPVPDEILQQARVAAGTRAEVLDLNDICNNLGMYQYQRQVKQGYALLSDEIRYVDEPEECLERCTHGFHYAFDSKYPKDEAILVCSNTKCLANKKGAFTRKKNAAGQALKKAEKAAIQKVLDEIGQIADGSEGGYLTIPRGVLELIIYNQLHGGQIASYYYGEKAKEPKKWLWDKLNAGTPQEKRNEGDLWKIIAKLSDVDLVKLIVEYMFFYLQDHGDTASYEIETIKPLGFFGVTVGGIEEKEPAAAGV